MTDRHTYLTDEQLAWEIHLAEFQATEHRKHETDGSYWETRLIWLRESQDSRAICLASRTEGD